MAWKQTSRPPCPSFIVVSSSLAWEYQLGAQAPLKEQELVLSEKIKLKCRKGL